MNASNAAFRNRAASLGFSMVELMVALTIGLLLIGGMIAVLISSSGTGKTRERASEIQNNGRFALETLKRDIQHAGFRGITGVIDKELDQPLGYTVENKCDEIFFGQVTRGIDAIDNNNKSPGNVKDGLDLNRTCLGGGVYQNDTDVVVVRHFSPSPVAIANLKSDLIYYQSSYRGYTPYIGTAVPALPPGWVAPLQYQLEENVYYISKFTASKDENPKIPALYRVRLTNGPKMVPELVASGVENMQIRFLERITFGVTSTYAYLERDAVTNMDQVKAVEISLLVRGSNAEPNLKNLREFKLGNETVKVPDDGIPRQVFTTVVFLRNF